MSVISLILSTGEISGSALGLSGVIMGEDEGDSLNVPFISVRIVVGCSLARSRGLSGNSELAGW